MPASDFPESTALPQFAQNPISHLMTRSLPPSNFLPNLQLDIFRENAGHLAQMGLQTPSDNLFLFLGAVFLIF
ncbi:hypothetical protein TMatcc_003408 [Talaromyces marneffei ATCC 18224]